MSWKPRGRTGFKMDAVVSCVKSCWESSKTTDFDYTKVIDSFGKSSAYTVVETETGLEFRKKRMIKSGNGDYRPLIRDFVVKRSREIKVAAGMEMWDKRNYFVKIGDN